MIVLYHSLVMLLVLVFVLLAQEVVKMSAEVVKADVKQLVLLLVEVVADKGVLVLVNLIVVYYALKVVNRVVKLSV